jgi:hypothetical protein
MLRLAVEKLLTHTRRLTFAHIREIEHLTAAPSGSTVSLPLGLTVTKSKGTIIFYKK